MRRGTVSLEMWKQPYLETCCRASLHRLLLCGDIGRPSGLKDGPCLEHLAEMGLAEQREDGRYALPLSGMRRHASEIAGLSTGSQ